MLLGKDVPYGLFWSCGSSQSRIMGGSLPVNIWALPGTHPWLRLPDIEVMDFAWLKHGADGALLRLFPKEKKSNTELFEIGAWIRTPGRADQSEKT